MPYTLLLAAVFQALPTERVMPRGALSEPLRPADRIELSLARNEKESVQVVVAAESDMSGVRVAVDGLPMPVDCDTVAYTLTTNEVHYTHGAVRGPAWYPDTIIPTPKDGVSIRKGDRQSFWIRVRAGENQPSGMFAGTLTVFSSEGVMKRLPMSVKVRNFTLPKATMLPLAITFSPEVSLARGSAERKDVLSAPDSPVNIWRTKERLWYEFLADYGITPDSLYWNNLPDSPLLADEDERWNALSRLKAEGRLGRFNLGYFGRMDKGPEGERVWRKRYLNPVRRAYDRALREGLLDHAYIYGCDELDTNYVHEIRRAISVLKKECPGVPLMTTAKDYRPDGKRAYGCGTVLADMDIFVPLTDKFDAEQAERAREEGRRVWWYTCCWPHGKSANMFIESLPIEGRLLVGAMSAKLNVDGYLFYQTSIWNSRRTIGGCQFTDWTAQSWESYNGDGSWTRVAADGSPLPTIRLENFRDGLEDYAYAKLYQRKFGHPAAIPDLVVKDIDNYDCRGDALAAWRDKVAAAIEERPSVRVAAGFSAANPPYRASVDLPFRHDMTVFDGVRFDITIGDVSQFSGFTFYYHAGDGWYAQTFEPKGGAGSVTVRIGKDGGIKEGAFAGFGAVDAVRICGWRLGRKDTFFEIDNLRPYTGAELGTAAQRKRQSVREADRAKAWVATLPPGCESEFRAFWCHSPNGMPGMNWGQAVKHLRDSGFNALLVNLAWGGWTRLDRVEEIASACRKYGVKFHVWKVCWHMWWGGPEAELAKIESEGRCAVAFDGSKERWMCPNDVRNRKLEADLCVMAAKSGVDGVHLDYIRYPDANRCFCERCRSLFEKRIGRTVADWPKAVREDASLGAEWRRFRRETITSFVREVSKRVRAEAPGVELSAAVMPNPDLSVDGVAQEWTVWCKEGLLDFICPMDYFGSLGSFEVAVKSQKRVVGGVRLYPGIGLSSDGANRETRVRRTAEQIMKTRELGLDGFAVFNYDALAMDVLEALRLGPTRRCAASGAASEKGAK